MSVRIVLDDGTIGFQEPSSPVIKLGEGPFDGYVLFEHDCINSQGDAFRCGGYLPHLPIPNGWTIVSKEPLTVSPSILCHACKSHGFITDGKWISV